MFHIRVQYRIMTKLEEEKQRLKYSMEIYFREYIVKFAFFDILSIWDI